MNDRRRFLEVLSGSVIAAGVGCGGDAGSGAGGATAGTGGTAGAGGTGPACGGGGEASLGSNNDLCGSDAGRFDVGTPADFAAMGLHQVKNTAVLIGRDAGGLYALSALCTHACCNMSSVAGIVSATGIRCICHNSRFDLQGKAISGPANGTLDAYELQLGCDGELWVDTTKVVPAGTRLAV